MTGVGKAEVCHLLIYEGGLRCVNLSPSISELNRQFKVSTNTSLDSYCRTFLEKSSLDWDASKATKRQVLLDGKMYSLVAVEGDRASKVILFMHKDNSNNRDTDLTSSKQQEDEEYQGSEVLPLLHRSIVTFLDFGFLLRGEAPTPSSKRRGSKNIMELKSRGYSDLPPLPCGVRDFEDAFALFDREGTGMLNSEKFQRGLDVLDVRLNKKEAERLFRMISNSSDSIDYRHFLRFFTTDGSRKPGPMALRAGLARAKSVSHFSTISNDLPNLEPTKTEKRIRGLERVLAILELHTGRYANSMEFDLTRSFILVNRKALSRYRRFVFRRLLSVNQDRVITERRRSITMTTNVVKPRTESIGKENESKTPISETEEDQERPSISCTPEEVTKLKDRIKELEHEVKKYRRRRNHTIDFSGANTSMERILQMNLRKLQTEKKDFDKKMRTIQEKAELRQENLKKEIRRVKSQREKLREEIRSIKAKARSSPASRKEQLEEEILWNVRKTVDKYPTKLRAFESELAWKLSSANNVYDYVSEMRRVLNDCVKRTEKMSEDMKRVKKEVNAKWKRLEEFESAKAAFTQDAELPIEPWRTLRKFRGPQSPMSMHLKSPTHTEHFLSPLGQEPSFGVTQSSPISFSSPRASFPLKSKRKVLKRTNSEPTIHVAPKVKWHRSKGERGLSSGTSPVCSIPRLDSGNSPSSSFVCNDELLSKLTSEKEKLIKVVSKLRYDLEISELQRDRHAAQIGELRRTLDIYREHNKPSWEVGVSKLEREVKDLRERLDESQAELVTKTRQLRFIQGSKAEGSPGLKSKGHKVIVTY